MTMAIFHSKLTEPEGIFPILLRRWGDQTLSIHAHHAVSTAHHAVNLSTQPLRNLLRPSKSSSGMSTSGASGPLPPEVHEPQILEAPGYGWMQLGVQL